MSSYQKLKMELTTYILARTPFIIIDTAERERIERMMNEICEEQRIDIDYYSDYKQVYSLSNSQTFVDAQSEPVNYAINSFKKKRRMTFVISDINHVSNDNSFSRDLLNAIYVAKENNCTLIIITADPVWNRLNSMGMFTSLDFPIQEERVSQISDFIKRYKTKFTIDWDDVDIALASTMMKGFSEIQIDNILSSELIAKRGLFKKDIYSLASQKNKIHGQMSNVEYINLPKKVDISGLDNLKVWLEKKKEIFMSSSSLLEKYDLSAPKGVLLIGVPGCGKSLSAKMIAQTWQLPLYKFNLDSIYDKWLGESERKMHDALKYIDSMAPCILWVDEIEKALSSNNSSDDVGKRIISQFLFWLQESKSKVFLVATANDVSLLPPELFRKGRFSEVFYVGLPNKLERKDVIALYMHKSLHCKLDDYQMEELVRISEGYSYSDIETAIKETAENLVLDHNYRITFEGIINNFIKIVPISKSNPEIIQKLDSWGKTRANPASNKEVK